MNSKNIILVAIFLMLSIGSAVLIGCKTNPIGKTLENDLVKILKDNGWIIFPIPDSKYKPGTVFQFTEEDGPEFRGYLSDCGVPDSLTKPVPGVVPQMFSSGTFKVGVDLSLKIVGVPVGVNPKLASSAKMTIGDSGSDELNLIRFDVWRSDPNNRINKSCKEKFEAGNHYVASSAFRVSSGTVEYKRDAGVTAGLSDVDIGKVADLKAKGYIQSVSDGKVVFKDSDFYIAFKGFAPLDEGLTFLSGDEPSDEGLADAKILKWLDSQ